MKFIYTIIIFALYGGLMCKGQAIRGSFFQTKDKTQEIFFNDSIFEYEYKFGMSQSACSKGKWQYIQGNMILDSDHSDFNSIPIKVHESEILGENDSLAFNMIRDTLFECSHKGDIQYFLVTDENDSIKLNDNTLLLLRNISFFRILMYIDDINVTPKTFISRLETENYYIKDLKSNRFDIYLQISNKAFNYLPLIGTTLQVKRNKLIWKGETIPNTFITENEVFYKKTIKDANLISKDQCKCNL